MKFIVELETGVWIARWDGDPGRTVLKENAQLFNFKIKAIHALKKAQQFRSFPNSKIVEVPEL